MKLGDIQLRKWMRLKKTSNAIKPWTFVRGVGKKFDVVPVKENSLGSAIGISESGLEPGEDRYLLGFPMNQSRKQLKLWYLWLFNDDETPGRCNSIAWTLWRMNSPKYRRLRRRG